MNVGESLAKARVEHRVPERRLARERYRKERPDPASSGESVGRGCPDGSSMIETIGEGAGWLWIRNHAKFVHGVFYDL